MSVSFESILDIMKIDAKRSKNKELPQIVELKEELNFGIPEKVEEMNEILKRYEIPVFPIGDSVENRLKWFGKLNMDEVFTNISVKDLQKTYSDLVRKWELEKKCDTLEVELANMHAEGGHHYYSRSIEELKKMIERSKSEVKRMKWSDGMREILEEIRIRKAECWNKFMHLKGCTEGAFYKIMINEKLKGKLDEGSKALLKIVNERISNIEKIGSELGIERVNLLKIIYHMSSRNIIEFDRLNGTVSLVGSEIKPNK